MRLVYDEFGPVWLASALRNQTNHEAPSGRINDRFDADPCHGPIGRGMVKRD
jgi:hypothetical protein